MSKKVLIFISILLIINTKLILGNEFYNAYKSNFIDKWNAIAENNKEEKVKFLQQHLKDIRNFNPRKLRKLVLLKMVELGAKSESTYREGVNAGLYLAKSGLIEGKNKIELLSECEKKCEKLFISLKFNRKEEKLQAAKDLYQIQESLVKENLKTSDYIAAKSWLTKLLKSSESVRDPRLLKTLDEDLISLKGQVESCSKTYKQITGKFNYTGSLKTSFNNHLFMQYLSPSLSLPYYEESKDANAIKSLKTFLAFQNKGKKVLKGPYYLCSKDTNLPPQLLLTKLSKIEKVKESAQFVLARLDEGRHQFYKPIIISTYELINSDGFILPNNNLDMKSFYQWAISITKGIDSEILFNYIPQLVKSVNDSSNGLNKIDRSQLLDELNKTFISVQKKLHLYKFQNEPAPQKEIHPKVKEWLSMSKQDRREIVKDVYNKLRDLHGGQDSRGLYIRELSLRIDSSCDYKSFWPLARIPFTHINIDHFHHLESLEVFQSMPLENVNISWSAVKSISALKNQKNLRILNISGSGVKTLSSLQGLKLTNFWMTHLKISDLSPLEGMPISHLDISFTQVNSLKHLKGMPLVSLNARNLRGVKSLSPLEHTLLRTLNINGCSAVRSLEPLKNLKLNYLYIEETSIDDLSPLSKMALRNLYFTQSIKIKSLKPIRWMQIERLGLSNHTQLSQALSYYFPLNTLKLAYTKVKDKDLSYLKNFQLKTLELFSCPLVKDLRVLKFSPLLTTLNISNCKSIKSLKGITDTNTENLYMNDINVKDFSQLAGSKVKKIEAQRTGLVTLKGISEFPIIELDIRNSQKLIDISEMPDSTLKNLRIKGHPKLKSLEPMYKTKDLVHDMR